MSATAAGKFQDHYTILGVEPKATSDVIQAAYAKLAQRYHKDNPDTGDPAKFETVNLAFEVLCDATLRAEFDKIKGIDKDDGKPLFSGMPFFESLTKQNGLRSALLSVLYDRRQQKPYRPSLSMRHLDGMLAATNEEMNFAIWYLKQRGLIESDDKSNLQIAVSGMDFLEQLQPVPELVLAFLKPAALANPSSAAPAVPGPAALLKEAAPSKDIAALSKGIAAASKETAAPSKETAAPKPAAEVPSPKQEPESVSKVLNRALARR